HGVPGARVLRHDDGGGAGDAVLPGEHDCRGGDLLRSLEAARLQAGDDQRRRRLRASGADRVRENQPPVTLMWRATAGALWRRSMRKSWPLGLRLIASWIAASSSASSVLARSGARRSAASSWPRHI